MLVHGSRLTPALRREVLRAFIYRWTHENAAQNYQGQCPACFQGAPNVLSTAQWHTKHAALVSDAEWLNAHAFHVTKDGTRLMENERHAEPAFLVDAPVERRTGERRQSDGSPEEVAYQQQRYEEQSFALGRPDYDSRYEEGPEPEDRRTGSERRGQ